jgi:IS6 family transposase
LNNLIEQDHRGVKSRLGPMLGLTWFRTAATTIAGIELPRRIRNGSVQRPQFAPQRRKYARRL